MEAVHTAERLKELQALPLERKVLITQTRIIEWYQHHKGDVCVSFSGGKDSTVLLHLVRQLYPDVKAVFADTGLEYPEIKEFVKKQANVEIVRPKMRFDEVIRKYGYPLIGKDTALRIYLARKIRMGGGTSAARRRLVNDTNYLGENSIFELSKWLPLTRDLPFEEYDTEDGKISVANRKIGHFYWIDVTWDWSLFEHQIMFEDDARKKSQQLHEKRTVCVWLPKKNKAKAKKILQDRLAELKAKEEGIT